MSEEIRPVIISKIWNFRNSIKIEPKKIKRVVNIGFQCELSDANIEKIMVMQKNDLPIIVEIKTPQTDLPLMEGKK